MIAKKTLNITLNDLNNGEHDSFDTVFRYYYPSLCYFAENIVGSGSAAEDVVQSVFLGFYENKPRFENITALRSYLYVAVNNRSIKYLNKQKRNIPADDLLADSKAETDNRFHMAMEANVVDEIFKAIDTLPDACRRIFEMSYIEHRSVKDICEELQISENTVKTQRQRAKKILRERLQGLYRYVIYIFF